MHQAQCARCGKPLADANETKTCPPVCPYCGRPPQAAGAERPARTARPQSALDREFELLCLMDDVF